MKAKYIGDPSQPKGTENIPDEFEAYGLIFERGKFTDVPANLAAKFDGNSHFETREGKSAPAVEQDDGKETLPDLADRIAGVRDVESLKGELKSEKRSGGKTIIEARIRELEAPAAE